MRRSFQINFEFFFSFQKSLKGNFLQTQFQVERVKGMPRLNIPKATKATKSNAGKLARHNCNKKSLDRKSRGKSFNQKCAICATCKYTPHTFHNTNHTYIGCVARFVDFQCCIYLWKSPSIISSVPSGVPPETCDSLSSTCTGVLLVRSPTYLLLEVTSQSQRHSWQLGNLHGCTPGWCQVQAVDQFLHHCVQSWPPANVTQIYEYKLGPPCRYPYYLTETQTEGKQV